MVGTPVEMLMLPEVVAVRDVALNCNVRAPTVPVINRLVNLVAPPASVVTLVVPPSAGPPVATAAVTTTPACGTALPDPSRN